MRHLLWTVLVALLAVSAGCGGDDESSDADAGRLPFELPSPGDAANAADFWKQAGEVELTDAMMEEFFEIAQEIKAAGDDKAKALLVWGKYEGWNMMRWSHIAGRLGQAQMSVAIADSAKEIQASISRMEQEIERVKTEIETATGDDKARLEAQLAQFEQIYTMQKTQFDAMLPGAKETADKNRAILEKWQKRWDELGGMK